MDRLLSDISFSWDSDKKQLKYKEVNGYKFPDSNKDKCSTEISNQKEYLEEMFENCDVTVKKFFDDDEYSCKAEFILTTQKTNKLECFVTVALYLNKLVLKASPEEREAIKDVYERQVFVKDDPNLDYIV